MEHTLSLHDSTPPGHTPAPEPFELPAPYDPPPAPFEPSASYEAPVPLHPYNTDVDVEESHDAPSGWVHEEVPAEAGEEHYTDDGAMRRIVLRLTGGETVELAATWGPEAALEQGRDAVRRIADAESTGDWPEFDGRFLRPDTIVSVDIQVAG
jgi:hypothetical protein